MWPLLMIKEGLDNDNFGHSDDDTEIVYGELYL